MTKKEMERKIEKLEREISGMRDYYSTMYFGFPDPYSMGGWRLEAKASVHDVVRAILDHLGLKVESVPAKEESIVLRRKIEEGK